MKNIRLMPVLITGMLCLLVLKSVGLMTGGGYMFAGPQIAFAQAEDPVDDEASSQTEASDTAEQQDSAFDANGAAADAASENLFSDLPEEGGAPDGPQDAIPLEENATGAPVPLNEAVSGTEKAVLSRLSERRAELDKLQAQLEERENLVAAAEARLEERSRALEALETRITALVDEKKAQQDEQFAGLVSMYENMKPKDAAVIFNDLTMDILLRVALTMNPRKMSPILAAMRPERAQELTVAMAEEPEEPTLDGSLTELDALPQIVGQ